MVSCLVRATRCLSALENKYSPGPTRAFTRVQVKSRAWHKSSFALQGALRGSSKERVKLSDCQMVARQRLRCPLRCMRCCSSLGVNEAWTVWALRFEKPNLPLPVNIQCPATLGDGLGS